MSEIIEKFIEKTSQGIIFYKQPFLPHEINQVKSALKLQELVKERIEILDKWNNRSGVFDGWYHWDKEKYGKIMKELQSLIEESEKA